LFVANVNVDGASLNANVNSLDNSNVWNAEYRNRVVMPQLTFSPRQCGEEF
jgi:hypothetical protein